MIKIKNIFKSKNSKHITLFFLSLSIFFMTAGIWAIFYSFKDGVNGFFLIEIFKKHGFSFSNMLSFNFVNLLKNQENFNFLNYNNPNTSFFHIYSLQVGLWFSIIFTPIFFFSTFISSIFLLLKYNSSQKDFRL
jgi:hypothetical protein